MIATGDGIFVAKGYLNNVGSKSLVGIGDNLRLLILERGHGAKGAEVSGGRRTFWG